MPGLVLETIAEKVDVGELGEFESLRSQINAMSHSQLIDLFHRVQSSLPRPRKTDSHFAYAANSELSGFLAGITSYNERARKRKEACYFATSYADQLVLIDPFHHRLDGLNTEHIDEDFISDFSFFLSMLIMMDPIIDKNIVTFTKSVGPTYCSKCFYRLLRESDEDLPGLDFLKRNTDDIIRKSKVRLISIDKDNKRCIAITEGPPDIFGDDPIEIHFQKRGRIFTNKNIGKFISKEKPESLGILYPFSRYSIQDFSTKERVHGQYGINRSFVNSREISLLKKMFGDEKLFASNFELDAPILMANSLSDLVSMREQEWHHFEKFRNALHTCSELSDKFDAEEVYRETVIPEMINIERIIERNKISSGKELIRNSGIALLSITAAVMTAGLSTLLSAAAGVIGAGHFAKSMVPAVHDYLSIPEEARDSKFYYAWKLKNVRK